MVTAAISTQPSLNPAENIVISLRKIDAGGTPVSTRTPATTSQPEKGATLTAPRRQPD